jgi:hypothetical protein
MNPPNEPTNPQVPPGGTPPPLRPSGGPTSSFEQPNVPPPEPLPPDAPAGVIFEAMLKRPAQLVETLRQAQSFRLPLLLGGFALLALAAYGLVVGSFSGGVQWIAAPLKISLGGLISMAICVPSLFIFTCLTGAEVTLRGVVGALCAALALTALMLIGLAPVVWVFSQSTDALVFMGMLHLIFWLIALSIGLKLMRTLMDLLRVQDHLHLKVWMTIFVLVTLQMTTALRPILGKSDHWLPTEKKFFVAHWLENMFADGPASSRN